MFHLLSNISKNHTHKKSSQYWELFLYPWKRYVVVHAMAY